MRLSTGKGRRINVIYPDNGSGLSRDAVVMQRALRLAGHSVWMTPRAPRSFPLELKFAPELIRDGIRAVKQRLVRAWTTRRRGWDINIFLEGLVPDYFERARFNCFVPNEEWLTDEDRQLFGAIDVVLFKTRQASRVLASEARASAFIGFTSLDRRDAQVSPRWDSALHVSGWNPHKGTDVVLSSWSRHPEWPQLTVVSQLPLGTRQPANVAHVSTRIVDSRLRRLQNLCGVHVCPSEVEGFGHTIMEALSCGAVVVTTNAPPMDELLSPTEGFLVPFSATTPLRAGTRYFVEHHDLSETLARLWQHGADTLREKRQAARARYEELTASFRMRLAGIIEGL